MDKAINLKFNVLMAIGMIAVVGQHTGFIFVEWLGNPFHLPLFFFISGYFFSDKPFKQFLIKKFKHLVVPFLMWNAFYGILINFLAAHELIAFYHQEITIKSLLWDPFTMGWQFIFNAASWFVGVLFPLQIFYWILYRSLKYNFKYLCLLLILLHVLSLWLVFNGYTKVSYAGWFPNFGLAVSRIFYSLIFYYLGHIYRLYLENKDVFSISRIISVFLCNALILGFVSKNITIAANAMQFPKHNYWMPFVLSVGGIYVCLQVAELLSKYIDANSMLHNIGRRSWDIMMHQHIFFWLVNFLIYMSISFGIISLESFDYDKYMHNIYFQIKGHYPVNQLIYFIAGLMGPVVCCCFYEKFLKERLTYLRNIIYKKMYSVR